MDEKLYNRYLTLLNRRYRYDNTNLKLYSLTLKLMSWQYNSRLNPWQNQEVDDNVYYSKC
jgi:hypothetical protein